MARVTLIAALGANRVIGREGKLPWHIPGDLPRFKATTLGQTLVMGRKTYDSIGRALPGRTTIVITRSQSFSAPGVEVAHSLDEALAMVKTAEAFVAGGGEIYSLSLEHADRMLLTEVDASVEGDTFFPEFDRSKWRLAHEEVQPASNAFPHAVRYREYIRSPNP